MSEQVNEQLGENSARTASAVRDPFSVQDSETPAGEPTLGPAHRRRRTTKVDDILAAAQDVALSGIEAVAPHNSIGLVHHLRGEEERLTTHLFECTLPGYRGWFWFATLARAPRSKNVTICEVGLIPGDDALLAPEWLPWADRLQGEEREPENLVEDSADVLDIQDDEDPEDFEAQAESDAAQAEGQESADGGKSGAQKKKKSAQKSKKSAQKKNSKSQSKKNKGKRKNAKASGAS